MAVRTGRSCDAHGETCKAEVKSYEIRVWQVAFEPGEDDPRVETRTVVDDDIDMITFDCCDEGLQPVLDELAEKATRKRNRIPKPAAQPGEGA